MSSNDTPPPLRSQPSRSLSFVRFHNVTRRKVDVIWINYEGSRVKYKTLDPEEFCDVNTYVAHPWVFQDAVTHQSLNANSKHIYEPGPWYEVGLVFKLKLLGPLSNFNLIQEYLPDLRSGKIQRQDLRPKRVVVNITTPLYSLKDSAMIVIIDCLKNPDQVQELEIPKQFRQELADLIKHIRKRFT